MASLTIRITALLITLVLAGCATETSAENQPSEMAVPTPSTTTPPTVATTSTTVQEEDTAMPEPSKPISDCVRLTDFATEAERRAWQTVNDNVMGGRSSGGPSFSNGLLVFSGVTNTDGGGFSSLRLPLEPEALSEFDRVVLRAKPDGRDYMITFDDNVSSRDRRVSHRAPLGFERRNEWQEVSVSFDELFPAIFGRRIDDLPFDKTLATRMGIMISDGLDGPFRLEVDWIDACR